MPAPLRRAVLSIGARVGAGVAIDTGAPDSAPGLRIQFQALHVIDESAGFATVRIYNLGRLTPIALMDQRDDVLLEAGYDLALGPVFRGQIVRIVRRERVGDDVITTIDVGDGTDELATAELQQVFPRGTSVERVVEDLLSALALVEEGTRQAIRDAVARAGQRGAPTTLRRALSFSGSVAAGLRKLGRAYGFNWWIQDLRASVVARDRYASPEAIVLSPPTGLIGEPQALDEVEVDDGVLFESVGGEADAHVQRERAGTDRGLARARDLEQQADLRRPTARSAADQQAIDALIAEAQRIRAQARTGTGRARQDVPEPTAFEPVETVGLRRREGVRLECRLDHRLRPGVAVGVQSADFPRVRTYRCERVEFDGDSEEGPWRCHVEAWRVGGED